MRNSVIELIQSNRLEVLAAHLAEALAQPGDDPALQPAIVLVPHPGMARWLRRWLAERIGICANIEFVLPAVFAWRVLAARLTPVPSESVYAREVLVWRLIEAFPELLPQREFASLRSYLAEDGGTRLYPLAAAIADSFDRYQLYRGDWLQAWENDRRLDLGEDEAWQQPLWRRLTQKVAEPHRAALFQRLLQHPFDHAHATELPLPAVIHGFGLSQLAPVHLDVLRWLGSGRRVRLYQLNYSLHYWADLTAERDLARYRARWLRLGLPDRSEYHEVGHPLLASWGKPGQEFLQRLHEAESLQEHDAFELASGNGLLARLQRSLLLLDARQLAAPIDAADRSLLIHACANRLREVEALHDALLDAFSADQGAAGEPGADPVAAPLLPRDVVVMVPQIADYASAINAVFAAQPTARQIPFRIADGSLLDEHPIVGCFRRLLELPQWRFSASEVLGFLAEAPVLRRFGISAQEYASLTQWVELAGIRWGCDASFRAELGLGEFHEHSWRHGLDRLFAGYALGEVEVWQGLAPIADIEGQHVAVLGQLDHLLQRLRSLRERFASVRSMAQWQTLLLDALDDFFLVAADDTAAIEALMALREMLGTLASDATRAELQRPIALAVLRGALDRKLAEPGSFSRFPGDGVTFCTLVPLRAVPFRVVALLGINDGEFPRQPAASGFDLMRQQPRRGDRNPRDDDRYLFLETLLAARDRVHLSYIDRRADDGQARSPSVLIDELLEFLGAAGTTLSDRETQPSTLQQRIETPRAAIVRQHPLQPFAAAYFSPGNPLWSFAEAWLPAARSESAQAPLPRFASAIAPLPQPAESSIRFSELQRFFIQPARVQSHERLEIDLRDDSAELRDDEIFAPDALENYAAKQAMLAFAQRHGSLPPRLPEALRLAGGFAPGAAAEDAYARDRDAINRLSARVREYTSVAFDSPHSAQLRFDAATLEFEWNAEQAAGLLGFRVGRVRARDRLSAWLLHLALSASGAYTESALPACFGLGKDKIESVRFAALPATEASAILATLIELYQRSFSALLPLFPESQYAYALALQKGDDAHAAVLNAWRGDGHRRGESADADAALLARGREPLIDAEFTALAQTLFAPLLASQSDRASLPDRGDA